MGNTLIQRHALFSTLRFEITDGAIVVTHRSPSSGFQERFSLFELSDNTEREMHREWAWIVIAALVALLSLPFFQDAIQLRAMGPAWVAGGVLAAAGVCVFMYFKRSWDRVIFRRWQDNRSAFVMWHNQPDAREFESFYGTLIDLVRRARLNPRMTPDQKMDVYTQHLQFLVDENVVSADQANQFLEQKRASLCSEPARVISLVKKARTE